jgi:mRNA-degrading endonuclease RelE of RelBE toxin-antitoxin system
VREVSFTPLAIRQFRRLPKAGRVAILDGVQTHLVEANAAETTRNKLRLRRPSEHADFELRLGSWRVFYRVLDEEVVVTLVGKKEGKRLLIDGEVFLL